ncbi:hypothetical protein SAMD00019534_053200 [Acytostelium subglobosum LB1]|uniref:hypothetical protein n=1 Tax=Acytostelium subglobosum LB1 TaxID=1410327 RepID=UPI000644F88C|nr:hypothetical protein SAMD00019534_053200 [Acytostelium subglobosum LB1]GAM22145.1 hypothetical protein SAMD00019534_053200 [Acytostelium subglobosum LB1]|eukprot:XP_012755245.1 hypothetical protein SAMD00019534_053200 [Acytostelium subglobosum LB1]
MYKKGCVLDPQTFNIVYNKYQRYFTYSDSLAEEIVGGHLSNVQTLLQQTVPMTFNRRDSLLLSAINPGNLNVLKYLLDSGLFNNESLWKNQTHEAMKKIVKLPPSSILFLLDTRNKFPTKLVKMIRSRAQSYVNEIVSHGNQQLIDELMIKKGLELTR